MKKIINKIWKGIWKSYPPVTAYDGGMPSIGCIGITSLVALGIVGLFGWSLKYDLEKTRNEKKPMLQESNSPITARVLEEFYEKRENESSYFLKCMTDKNKEIYLSVIDAPAKQKESLDSLLSKGSNISFPKGNISEKPSIIYGYVKLEDETYFTDSTAFGNKRADRIKILK